MLSSSSTEEADDDDGSDEDDYFDEDIEQDIENEARKRSLEDVPEEQEENVESFLADIAGPKRPTMRIDGNEPIAPVVVKAAMARPSQVVKRTTRIIQDNGTEVIEIGATKYCASCYVEYDIL